MPRLTGSGQKGRFTRLDIDQITNESRQWLTLLDIQIMMGVGYDYMDRLEQNGLLPDPSHFVGQERRWRRQDILSWLDWLAARLAKEQGVDTPQGYQNWLDKKRAKSRRAQPTA